jgi:UDP-glucose 4-epimerase
MTVMVTGGAGYIGSHTCVELIRARHAVVIYDNFCNSHSEVVNRIGQITGVLPDVVRGDIRDGALVEETLAKFRVDSVIHFAGLKSVADSVRAPLDYYDANVLGTLKLIQAMQNAKVYRMVFSSSATVYGLPISLPFRENHSLLPVNPYGQTKLVIENMLTDLVNASDLFKVAILRYFNPVGAHESGLIGEDPNGVPNNVMPFIAQVAIGRRPHLEIFGNDYETPDGTGVRDYVHVMDVAAGHLKALERVKTHALTKVNLGTGNGISVLELVQAFGKASEMDIACEFAPRREGDIACFYACPDLATDILGWRAKRDLADMCRDAWRWQTANPEGYRTAS